MIEAASSRTIQQAFIMNVCPRTAICFPEGGMLCAYAVGYVLAGLVTLPGFQSVGSSPTGETRSF